MSTDPLQTLVDDFMFYRLAARAVIAEVDAWCTIQRSNPWRHRQEHAVAGIVKRATEQVQQLEAMYDAETVTPERAREQRQAFLTIAQTVIRDAGIVPDLQDDLRALLRSRDFRASVRRAAEDYVL